MMAADTFVYSVIALAAVALWWLTRAHAAWLPVWAPWEFSFVEFFTAWLTVWWYLRGLLLTPRFERPGLARQIAFFLGLFALYAVLETRFEFLAEHQFFFNRIQHVVLHHAGPFLLALSWPGASLMHGMPAWLRRVLTHRALTATIYVLQQPILAAVLFSGSFFFWLIPSIHFHAMIDPRLYALMNWTMAADGILFWCLVLDPRPSPPARVSFGGRAALAMVVMFPQILGGAMIAFNPRDLYAFYDLCGRIYPDMGALYDQTVGGLIVWIPPAMMSVLALLLVLNALRRAENAANENETFDENDRSVAIDATQWTG
jgi:putative membrane protein